jgi:hypothetical protein
MTKLVHLRVIIPADDEIPIGMIQDRLRELIEPAGMEVLPDPTAPAGETGTPPPLGRVHWMAVDVRRGSGERAAPARPPARRSPSPAPAQGEL